LVGWCEWYPDAAGAGFSAFVFTPQEVLENMTPPEGMEKLYDKLETVASTWKE
jgi:hypothetical protein